MSVYARITSEDIADFLSDITPGVWVVTNIVPPTDGFGLWLAEYTSAYELRKLTIDWSRDDPSGILQDVAQCTFHFLNLTGGLPDDTWTTGDYTNVETFAMDFWEAIQDFYTEDVFLSQFSWRADGPAFKPFGAGLSPVLRNVAASNHGTDATHMQLPPQVAMTVTEVTASKFTVTDVEGDPGTHLRNRWGRFYLPAPAAGNANSEGRIGAVVCGAIADAVQTYYNAAVAADLIPVMYSPTTGHAWTVDAIHVDDIFDVIRSRRYVTPTTREPRDIDAAA